MSAGETQTTEIWIRPRDAQPAVLHATVPGFLVLPIGSALALRSTGSAGSTAGYVVSGYKLVEDASGEYVLRMGCTGAESIIMPALPRPTLPDPGQGIKTGKLAKNR